MTVKELIQKLEAFPPDMTVRVLPYYGDAASEEIEDVKEDVEEYRNNEHYVAIKV